MHLCDNMCQPYDEELYAYGVFRHKFISEEMEFMSDWMDDLDGPPPTKPVYKGPSSWDFETVEELAALDEQRRQKATAKAVVAPPAEDSEVGGRKTTDTEAIQAEKPKRVNVEVATKPTGRIKFKLNPKPSRNTKTKVSVLRSQSFIQSYNRMTGEMEVVRREDALEHFKDPDIRKGVGALIQAQKAFQLIGNGFQKLFPWKKKKTNGSDLPVDSVHLIDRKRKASGLFKH